MHAYTRDVIMVFDCGLVTLLLHSSLPSSNPSSPTKSEFIRSKYQMLSFVHKLPCRDDDGVTTKDLSKVSGEGKEVNSHEG